MRLSRQLYLLARGIYYTYIIYPIGRTIQQQWFDHSIAEAREDGEAKLSGG
jgi:hypothetical protein